MVNDSLYPNLTGAYGSSFLHSWMKHGLAQGEIPENDTKAEKVTQQIVDQLGIVAQGTFKDSYLIS